MAVLFHQKIGSIFTETKLFEKNKSYLKPESFPNRTENFICCSTAKNAASNIKTQHELSLISSIFSYINNTVWQQASAKELESSIQAAALYQFAFFDIVQNCWKTGKKIQFS